MSQPRWLALAWGDLGVAETPGAHHTARVLAYYADVGHPEIADDETAWCAAFLGACLERAGFASTRSLMARSYLAWGEPLDTFRHGAVAVLSRTADPTLGHAGFLVGETPDSVILLGGNQSDAVTVEAFPRTRLLGLRWPTAVIPQLPPVISEGARANTPPVIPEGASAPIRDPTTPPVIPEGASAPIRDPTTPPVIPEAEGEARGYPGPRAASESLFALALAHVLEMEGGWTDDPYDPGGPTNFGITLATYARDKGVDLTAASIAQLKAELRSIPPATVRRIYRDRYWRAAACPQMPPALAFFHFDAAVNQGVTGSSRLLQEAVGAVIDGEIGPETLGKAAARPMQETLVRYADARRRHYRSLSHFWRFGNGWLARVEATLAAATAIAAAAPSPPPGGEGGAKRRVGGTPNADDLQLPTPQQPKETKPMTDTTQPDIAPAAPDTKWWGQSLTIWGVIVTALSTVLPALGPVIGLDITAELIRQLGDQIVVVVQAVGGLIGTILTIWGRARATSLLGRKQVTMKL